MKKGKLDILEGLRGAAAIYVVFHHVTLRQKNVMAFIFSEGQFAVILFFLLSGFVICYSSIKEKERGSFDFRIYFLKRFRRIYPVLIAALAIAYFSRCINTGVWASFKGTILLGNLFNLQDMGRIPGNPISPYHINTPLWSLSYEWWFYMLFFPIFKWIKDDQQKFVTLALSIVGFVTFYLFPNKLSITLEYFFIWWSGVELARSWVQKGTIEKNILFFLALGYSIMIALLALQVKLYKGQLETGSHPVIELRHYCYGAIIILIGLTSYRFHFYGLKTVLKPFMIFAPISYAIYVIHFPLMVKFPLITFKNGFYTQAVGFVIVIVLSYLLEVVLQSKINKWTNKYISK